MTKFHMNRSGIEWIAAELEEYDPNILLTRDFFSDCFDENIFEKIIHDQHLKMVYNKIYIFFTKNIKFRDCLILFE